MVVFGALSGASSPAIEATATDAVEIVATSSTVSARGAAASGSGASLGGMDSMAEGAAAAAVPEPSTFTLLGAAAAGLSACLWRRFSAKSLRDAFPPRDHLQETELSGMLAHGWRLRCETIGVALAIVLAAHGGIRAEEPAAEHAGKRQNEAEPSKPVEKDGLSVVVVPTKRVFAVWEPLSFSVTYHNVSKAAFRLPDQPGYYNYWQMNLTKASKDKGKETTYTGKTSLPMGVAGMVRPTAPLEPGKKLTVEVKLDPYTYSEGKWNRAAASKELPLGKYR